MTEVDKKNLLRGEMQKYKQLRNKVSQKKAAIAGRKVVPAATKAEKTATLTMDQKVERRDKVNAPSAESLAEAVRELKQFIHSELNVLKQELKKLQKAN